MIQMRLLSSKDHAALARMATALPFVALRATESLY
jgi:hypothetical protein